jgi:hypothetical protein
LCDDRPALHSQFVSSLTVSIGRRKEEKIDISAAEKAALDATAAVESQKAEIDLMFAGAANKDAAIEKLAKMEAEAAKAAEEAKQHQIFEQLSPARAVAIPAALPRWEIPRRPVMMFDYEKPLDR